MIFSDFFTPVDFENLHSTNYESGCWYDVISKQDIESILDKKVILIGIKEHIDDDAPNQIRKKLYQLKKNELCNLVYDLGDFNLFGENNTLQSLGYSLSEMISQGQIPLIINGKNEVAYAQYLGFSYLKKYINFVSVDAKIDFNLLDEAELTSRNYLQKILLEEPSYLFHFTNIGHQNYFEEPSTVQFLEKLYFELFRLGDARADLSEMEPSLRSAQCVSFDLSCIRQSDAPATHFNSPNGFFNDEVCRLALYSGLSNNINSIGIYGFDATKEDDGQTAHQVAQMIWFFVEGIFNRVQESPTENKDQFLKFITNLKSNGQQISFYKSKNTDRWWMEVPIGETKFANNRHIIPCTYNDYIVASSEDIPDRWWQTMKKLS
jgi:arginase family enzyme